MTLTPTKEALRVWRFSAAFVIAAVFSALTFLSFIPETVKLCSVAAVLLIYSVFVFFYLPKLQKSEYVKITDNSIFCRKGLFFVREYRFPRPKTLYLVRIKLPLISYKTEIAVLKGVGSSLILPLLSSEQADILESVVSE